ncbi:hypothetical protein N7468_010296 [Penicillium chermesinum]|uniref:Zn(2)-C6 fungal-type domain-containing protein n=1 Tax=Penicillium chermesinum TaxID=63820 RepID=A0A9W9NCH2_9EURO|nr:uncharacterized protein N7468_010296 [Penicillium chermesinum]KAJ5217288.1 hypothetical protein N7468_010296 [Penicillium chermesinum]
MAESADTPSAETVKAPTEANGVASQTPATMEGSLDQSNSVPEAGPDTSASSSESKLETVEPTTNLDQPDIASAHDRPKEATTTNPIEPTIESTLPEMDSTIQAMHTSQSLLDANLTSFDSALPSIGSSAAPDHSLPAIDTTLPSFDSSLPAIGTDIPTMDDHHTFDDSHFDAHDSQTGSAEPHNGHSLNGSTHYDAPSNGDFHYAQSDGQQPPTQAQSQHQFQATPQPQPPQNYQPQNQDMYHNPGFSTVNANTNNGQGQPGQIPQAPIGSPMPPMSSVSQYMAGYPSQSGIDSNGMRYPLPGDPNKMLSSARHKKEVKRRTKTGCLTCQKRRIKCDEGHPVCRNCVKSKRDCLGYDPVFRPSASTPSAIQPAPNNPPPSLVVNPQGPLPPAAPSYPSAPPGYMPASSQPFAPSLHSESPGASTDQFDPASSVDRSVGPNSTQASINMQAPTDPLQQGSEQPYKGIRHCSPAPHPIGALPNGRLEEIQAVFLATYAPAIDKLLEVRWYSEKALHVLMADEQLMADYSALIQAFNDWNLQDGNTLARLESFEASIIWRSMALCRQAQNAETGQAGSDWNLLVTCARLNAIEALLTWNHLEQNSLSRPLGMDAASPPTPPDQFMQRQLDFWSEIGQFLTLHDNEASSAKEIDDTLGRSRTLLDTYENRDIIYSMAIARHLGQRRTDFPNNLPKIGYTNEKEAGTKLLVAHKFIEEEAAGKGTTQIYKRICCMAVRSWWIARE